MFLIDKFLIKKRACRQEDYPRVQFAEEEDSP